MCLWFTWFCIIAKTGCQKIQMNLKLLSLSNQVFEFKFQLSVVSFLQGMTSRPLHYHSE